MTPVGLERRMLWKAGDDSWDRVEELGRAYWASAPAHGPREILERAVGVVEDFLLRENVEASPEVILGTVHRIWDGRIDDAGN